MLGVYANSLLVLVCGLLGALLHGGQKKKEIIPKRFEERIMQGMGLCVVLIGVSGAIKTQNILVVILSVALGAVLGELAHINENLNRGGAALERLVQRGKSGSDGESTFGKGFVSSTLLFCVGSMAVVGGLEAGLLNKPDTLLAKGIIDAVVSILLGATFGYGVALSSVSLLIYQGGIALLAGAIEPYLSAEVINEMSAAGSLLLIGLGCNMAGISKQEVKVANLLPATFLPIAMIPLYNLIAELIG